jgi:hypothetical protein
MTFNIETLLAGEQALDNAPTALPKLPTQFTVC